MLEVDISDSIDGLRYLCPSVLDGNLDPVRCKRSAQIGASEQIEYYELVMNLRMV